MKKRKNGGEVKKGIMGKEMVEVDGNIFKVIKGWEFYKKVGKVEGNYRWIFSRDRIRDSELILGLNEEVNIGVGYWYCNIYEV